MSDHQMPDMSVILVTPISSAAGEIWGYMFGAGDRQEGSATWSSTALNICERRIDWRRPACESVAIA